MNTIRKSLSVVVALAAVAFVSFVSFVSAPRVEAATDPTGVFTLPGIGNIDVGDWAMYKYSSSGNQNNRGLPLTVTNTAAVLATNVFTPLIKDCDLAIQFYFASLPTNSAATSNCVFRFVESADGGKTYTSQPTYTASVAQQGSNTAVSTIVHIGATNFAGSTHLKLLSISNTMTVGAGPMYITNVTFSQMRRAPRIN